MRGGFVLHLMPVFWFHRIRDDPVSVAFLWLDRVSNDARSRDRSPVLDGICAPDPLGQPILHHAQLLGRAGPVGDENAIGAQHERDTRCPEREAPLDAGEGNHPL